MKILNETISVFTINENILFAKINYNLKYDDFRDRVAATNLRIIDTMKRHSFNESVYEIYR